jgi:hypothetical protein
MEAAVAAAAWTAVGFFKTKLVFCSHLEAQ